jgi:glutamate-ammonia-ligase adenylyltransferase
MIEKPIQSLPETLRGGVEFAFERLLDSADEVQKAALQEYFADESIATQAVHAFMASQFVSDNFHREPELMVELLQSGDLARDYDADTLMHSLANICNADDELDEDRLMHHFRRFRQREMLRLIWRDSNRLCSLDQLTNEISWLAEAVLDVGLDYLYQHHCEQYGVPYGSGDTIDEAQRMIVIGMGKFGAHELNLSSDIDLIFAYPEVGVTRGGAKEMSSREFFCGLGQRLIKLIDQRTADGFVFRVDMRLRPYGTSGALAQSFAAMEDYYQTQGRDWERYAMIKARVVAGDKEKGQELMDMLRPFVFRRYIDFSVIESLRSMKAMIVREVARKGMKDNIKLGAGGIREIEFIVQVFQLVRGGRDTELQQRELRNILPELERLELLPTEAVQELDTAYEFLRNVEHALQGVNDQQTQQLPREGDERACQQIASALGFADWATFMAQLDVHREHVRRHFSEIIEPVEEGTPQEADDNAIWASLWMEEIETDEGVQQLESLNIDEAAASWELIADLKHSPRVAELQAVARERLDKLMPMLLAAAAEQENTYLVLSRTLPLIAAVLRRSAYLVLLAENPQALEQLVTLCEASPWIAKQLQQHPVLLDELLDIRSLYSTADRAELRNALRQQMLRIEEDDLEAQMDQLRYFRQSYGLRVAASEVSNAQTLMQVSDHLTFIAEAILDYVLKLAWKNMTDKHGYPPGCSADELGFIIIAYGKMGGIELGHGSDLDLVFVYEGSAMKSTDGDRPIDCQTFYTRLGQRIIHILGTRTAMGLLYEVDMRLRPSGNSGLLVSSTKAFTEYQQQKAWTWEHQALVRARVVAGSTGLAQWFEQTRKEILATTRDKAELANEVRSMRAKMREHMLADVEEGQFHLKQSPGGIVDIEFMVQYAVLANACQTAELSTYTDNVRILDSLEQALEWPAAVTEALRNAYTTYRAALHRRTLQEQNSIVPIEQFDEQRQPVLAQWRELFEE